MSRPGPRRRIAELPRSDDGLPDARRARADLHETANLASDPVQAKVFAEMHERLKAWQKEAGAPWVVKYSHE